MRLRLGRGLNGAQPDAGGSEGYGGEEVAGELVEAGGDATELFEFTEEALDQVSAAIKGGLDGALELDPALGGDVRLSACGGDEVEDCAAVVAAVGHKGPGGGKARQKLGDGGFVGALAGREEQAHGQTVLIDHGVDLGAQSATRPADGVIETPFFAPAACWWARTIELSIRCSDCGERAARASNIATHTPLRLQRLKRL